MFISAAKNSVAMLANNLLDNCGETYGKLNVKADTFTPHTQQLAGMYDWKLPCKLAYT